MEHTSPFLCGTLQQTRGPYRFPMGNMYRGAVAIPARACLVNRKIYNMLQFPRFHMARAPGLSGWKEQFEKCCYRVSARIDVLLASA